GPGGASTTAGGPADGATPGRRRRRPRAIVLAGAFAVLLAAAVAIPVIVLGGRDGPATPSADDRAVVSSRLAADATARRAQDPQLAARLSLAAYAVAPTDAARDALIASFGQSTAVRVPVGAAAYSDLALSPDGTKLAGTDDAGRLHLWRLDAEGRPTVAAEGSAGDHANGVVFDSNGRTLATGGATDAGRLWDVADPASPRPLGSLGTQATPVHRLALSTSAHLLATAGVDWSVGLWDVTDPGRPASLQLLIGRSGPVTGVALRPDGAVLAIAGVGGAVQLWNVRDPRNPAQMGSVPGHTGAVNTVAFSPDGRLLATGGDDRILQVSDVADPNHPRVVHRLPGHAAPVTTVAFATDDQLLSADGAGSVSYSNLAVTAPAFVPLGTLDSPVRAMSATTTGAVALTTDRGTILLGTLDPQRLRRLACARPAVALSRAEWDRLVLDIPWSDACAS
ncbi:WD40 repeat domain-containing protein, partial [Frankia sp. QA3]|uniref:WD40 repeat domain-containing protein n=1 Tax=Frankia sp. QA3 TaxID=710111 RepID=UPI000269B927